MRTILLSAFIFITLLSCDDKNNGITLQKSAGRINHVILVIENDLWKGEVGDSLRDIIASPILGLPQEETQFSISQVPPKTFSRLFQKNRNILLVGISEKEDYIIKKDIFAKPQITLNILGKDINSLLQLIQEHKEDIISVFKESDLKVYQKKITKEYHNIDSLKTLKKLNIRLRVPKSYALVDDTSDFLWFRQDIPKGSMNIIAYTLPLLDKDSIVNNISEARNTIGKKYIPGQFDGTFMITEAAYTPFTKETKVNGKMAYETRGKWEVKGDFMAGPFLNYTVVDKTNNRLLVVEGFTFAPSVKKRDYMFELEAILKTLKI